MKITMMWQVSQEEKNRNRSTLPEANARTHGLRSTASHGHVIRDVETVRDRAWPAMTVVTDKVLARNGDVVNVTVNRVSRKYSVSRPSGYVVRLHFLLHELWPYDLG